MNCDELTNQQLATAWERGMCTESPPASNAADIPPPTQTAVSGAGIPLPLLAIGAVAALTWGLQNASDYGRKKRIERYRPPAALPGGHMGQDALNASIHTPENVHTPGIPVHSHSESAPSHTKAYSPHGGYSEPSPWGMSEADKYSYKADRTASETTTGALWLVLRDCPFAEFKDRIAAGNIDPVAAADGPGVIAAREAVNNWLSHGVYTTNKVGWAVFGCDGQGGSARAKATVELVKRFRDEYASVNVRG